MPLQATSGAASYDAYGGNGVAVVPTYIEDVFSCFLYTGTGAAQTITNNIDLSTKGGLVWAKDRTTVGNSHILTDTIRGVNSQLRTNNTDLLIEENMLQAFTTSGFSLGTSTFVNGNTRPFVSWTWRKQPKFFDIQTWTGSGANRTISHALGSVPACIIVKRTDTTTDWQVYHHSLANTEYLVLNSTAAKATGATRWNSTTPTSTVFSLGTDATVNASGGTYIAYIFAHDAGGFGLTGTDNVISCGSYVGDGSNPGPTITLGYEPQFVMIKRASGAAGDWIIMDSMRDLAVNGDNKLALRPNLSDAESARTNIAINATGFVIRSSGTIGNASGDTYIYIAIRRGPMKVPTTGTSVFYPNAVAQANSPESSGVPFPPDLVNTFSRNGTDRTSDYDLFQFADRLRGLGAPNDVQSTQAPSLLSSSTAAEPSPNESYIQLKADSQNITRGAGWNSASYGNWIYYFWRRAPSFMDVVCFSGTGVTRTVSHNLAAVPELMIVKNRSVTGAWNVYTATTGNTSFLELNTAYQQTTTTDAWNNTSPTSSVFTVGVSSATNGSGNNLVAYLFATCAGVSKVGSYAGSGTTKQIDCGFTSGARFVLIKRINVDNYDWYVWDTARGIVSGNDSYLLLNSTAAEVTNTDYIDTYSAGFEISSTAPAAINANGGSFIFFAVA